MFQERGKERVQKIVVGLLDDDSDFLEMFSAYVRAGDYRDKIVLKRFTSITGLESGCHAGAKPDVLLANSRLAATAKESPQSYCRTAILLEDTGLAEGSLPDWPLRIQKYQPLNRLLDKLLSIAAEADIGLGQHEGSRTCTTICVYSAVGRSGKTTVAANLAKHLAYLDYRVFYTSLESLPSSPMFPCPGGDSFERVLYYIKSGERQLDAKWDSLKSFDSYSKVEYLQPPLNLAELEDMTFDDTTSLIRWISGNGNYDFAVFDLEASLHPRIAAALNACDKLVWLLVDDVHCLQKTKALGEEWPRFFAKQRSETDLKTSYLMNKWTGRPAVDWTSMGIVPDGTIPYVPQWKNVSSAEEWYRPNAFHDGLFRWVSERLTSSAREETQSEWGGQAIDG